MKISKLIDYILISFIVISLAYWLPRIMLFLESNFEVKPVKKTYLDKELSLFTNFDSALIKPRKIIEQPVNLNINLKGIITSSAPNSNIATISINNNELNLYSEGQEISKDIKLIKINIDNIIIQFGNNKKTIHLDEKK
jgi:type II secretory pathway component PulC